MSDNLQRAEAWQKSGVFFKRLSKTRRGLIGCIRLLSDRPLLMFFLSKAQGLKLVRSISDRSLVSADDAQTYDDAIRNSGLPENSAVANFSLDYEEGKCGVLLFLLSDNHLMSIASHLNSVKEVSGQIDSWVVGYDIPKGTVEQLKMRFYSAARLFPQVSVEDGPEDLSQVVRGYN